MLLSHVTWSKKKKKEYFAVLKLHKKSNYRNALILPLKNKKDITAIIHKTKGFTE